MAGFEVAHPWDQREVDRHLNHISALSDRHAHHTISFAVDDGISENSHPSMAEPWAHSMHHRAGLTGLHVTADIGHKYSQSTATHQKLVEVVYGPSGHLSLRAHHPKGIDGVGYASRSTQSHR